MITRDNAFDFQIKLLLIIGCAVRGDEKKWLAELPEKYFQFEPRRASLT